MTGSVLYVIRAIVAAVAITVAILAISVARLMVDTFSRLSGRVRCSCYVGPRCVACSTAHSTWGDRHADECTVCRGRRWVKPPRKAGKRVRKAKPVARCATVVPQEGR